MTVGKAMALIGGFLGAFTLGVVTAPSIMGDGRVATFSPSVSEVQSPDVAVTEKKRPAATANAATRSRPAIAPSAMELQEQLKPLLNKGADMTIAADGFRSAEQFAAVAHAARNTQVPFMLLKHRVLNEGKTLAAAIRESKPDMNAEVEATRAVAEARSDLARLQA